MGLTKESDDVKQGNQIAPPRWEIREGDALRLLLDVPDRHVDGVVTDCPYSSGGMTRGDRMMGTRAKYMNSDSGNVDKLPEFLGDTRDQRSFAYWATLWYAETLRASKDGALLFSFTDWRQLPSTTDAVQAGGWVWRGIVPWNKTEATRPQLGRPRAQCEYVVFATKGAHTPWTGAPVIPGFFTVPAPRERTHITEKPVELLVSLLSLVSPGGLVIDPFCGSGTAGVAALRTGHSALLFEMSHDIATDARIRLEAEEQQSDVHSALRGQEPLFANDATPERQAAG